MTENIMETEANIFACYLLMPDHLFRPLIAQGFSLDDDEWIGRVAKKFRVPVGAVVFRLILETRKALGQGGGQI